VDARVRQRVRLAHVSERRPHPNAREEESLMMAQVYEYKAEEIRSSLVGDKMDSGSVEELLNERAREGWQLRSLIATQVKGRVRPSGTEGLLAVFERPVAAV
jgi:hypothetical protein